MTLDQPVSGVSTITVYLRLNYDADKALTEINTKITSVLNQLPHRHAAAGADGAGRADHRRDVYRLQQRRAAAQPDHRLPRPRGAAEAAGGAGRADGGDPRAARISRCAPGSIRTKLAAYGLTATDVSQALAANNYISGLGTTKGQMVQVDLTASTDLHSLDEFRDLVIKQTGGAIVRLKDVANVTLGSDDYEIEVGFDGKRAVYIGIQVAPAANLLDVIARRARDLSRTSRRNCRRA